MPSEALRGAPPGAVWLALASVLMLGLGLAGPARAHDTWFEPAPATARGELGLVLGTGTQYPSFEFPIRMPQLVASGCRAEGVPAARLAWVADRPDALVLRSSQPFAAAAGAAAAVCWAQLAPIELEGIGPEIVALYLDEINAAPAVRAAWAAQQARGVRWQESYVKHARIEIDGAPTAASSVPPVPTARPVPMGMDALMTAPRRPVQVGDALEFQLLRDGVPLAGQAVEFRSNLSRFGFWRRSDAEGRVRFTPPQPARWLLRAVDLRLADGDPDRWQSRFLTLIFDVAQNPSSVMPNARSTNQTAASPAIATDPPASTPRR